MRRRGKRLKRKNLGTLALTPGMGEGETCTNGKANTKRITLGLPAARQTSPPLSPATLATKCDCLSSPCQMPVAHPVRPLRCTVGPSAGKGLAIPRDLEDAHRGGRTRKS